MTKDDQKNPERISIDIEGQTYSKQIYFPFGQKNGGDVVCTLVAPL